MFDGVFVMAESLLSEGLCLSIDRSYDSKYLLYHWFGAISLHQEGIPVFLSGWYFIASAQFFTVFFKTIIIVTLFYNQRVISIYSTENDACYLIGGIPEVMGTFESTISSFIHMVCTIFDSHFKLLTITFITLTFNYYIRQL